MIQRNTWQRFFICLLTAGVLYITAAASVGAARLEMLPDAYGEEDISRAEAAEEVIEGSYFYEMSRLYALNSVGLSHLSYFLPDPEASGRDTNGQYNPSASMAVSAPREEQVLSTVKVTATGYTAGYESTGKKPGHPQYGITYSGVKVKRDKNTVSTIAADPSVFPLGSILYIPDYGYGVVADIGSAIKGSKIDLYFDTTQQVFKEWGKKEVEVQVVKRGSGKCTQEMLNLLGEAIATYRYLPASVIDEAV